MSPAPGIKQPADDGKLMPKKKKAKEGTKVKKVLTQSVDEVLDCTDGAALVQRHLELGPDILNAYVTVTFANFYIAWLPNPDLFVPPSGPVLDYLERGSRLLGMTKVADLVKGEFVEALKAFRDGPVELDTSAVNNATAMNLLMP